MAEDKRTHNISTFETDDRIVEVVKTHIGTDDYSAAVRFIIRRFADISDPEGKMFGRGSKAARGFVSE